MVKVSIYRNKTREGEPVRIREMLPEKALDELIYALFYNGFVEEDAYLRCEGNSKADAIRISIATSWLGPVPTPYFMVFEGNAETEMGTLGLVLGWFVKATKSASADVLHKILS
jgi:hypothetical protein